MKIQKGYKKLKKIQGNSIQNDRWDGLTWNKSLSTIGRRMKLNLYILYGIAYVFNASIPVNIFLWDVFE